MQLTINEKRHNHTGDGSVTALLAELGTVPEHTALTRNGQIVPSVEWPVTTFTEGDHIELLVFVGGG